MLYLRYARPNINRPFKTPLFPITPLLGALMCIFLLMSLMAHELTRNFFIWYLAGGFVLYFIYGMWNSKLAKGAPYGGHEPQPELGARGLAILQQPLPERRVGPGMGDDPGAPVGKVLLELLHSPADLLRGDHAFLLQQLLHRPAEDFVLGRRAGLVVRAVGMLVVVVAHVRSRPGSSPRACRLQGERRVVKTPRQ